MTTPTCEDCGATSSLHWVLWLTMPRAGCAWMPPRAGRDVVSG